MVVRLLSDGERDEVIKCRSDNRVYCGDEISIKYSMLVVIHLYTELGRMLLLRY